MPGTHGPSGELDRSVLIGGELGSIDHGEGSWYADLLGQHSACSGWHRRGAVGELAHWLSLQQSACGLPVVPLAAVDAGLYRLGMI